MRTGVIIINTGSPASPAPEDVASYLASYLMDPRIRQMPWIFWHWLVYGKIIPKRKFTSAKRYQGIWTRKGSPLVAEQQALCDMVQWLFDEGRVGTDETFVKNAMSYGKPSIPTALWELRDLGCERVVCLPLYPQSAYCITGSVTDAFNRSLRELAWDVPNIIIDHYGASPAYLTCLAGKIRGAGFSAKKGDRLLCSYHAVPLKDVRAGDSYCEQAKETTSALAEMLEIPEGDAATAFQSAFGNPKRWAQPTARETLAALAKTPGRVFLCCPGFAVDCLETLYDVPNELEPAFEAGSLATGRLVWVPPLGPSPNHAQALYGMLTESIGRL